MNTFLLLCFAVYGLMIGSFLNVCIYRLPLGLPIAKGRSMCTRCQHPLTLGDMVPVLSYLAYRRTCRYCKAPISGRYALVEGLTSVVFALVFLQFGFGVQAIVYCLVACLLIVIAWIDIDTQTIPDGLNLALGAIGLLCFLLGDLPFWHRLLGGAIISLPMLLLALATDGFGGGDIKLSAACGLIVGFANMLVAMLIAVITGAAYGVILLRKGAHRKTAFCFGPFIALGVFISALYGSSIIQWYWNLL